MEAVAVSWVWCLHCGHCHTREEWEANGWCCPLPGCDGWEWDGVPWETVREIHPGYPEKPDRRAVYLLYIRQAQESGDRALV
jgi:hypothetical protein